MEITDVKLFLVEEPKLKAFVSIVIDGCFMVNDIKVIDGRDGLFLSMPSRRKRNGEFKDVAHPLNHSTRSMLEQRILEQYHRQIEAQECQAETQEPVPSEAPAPTKVSIPEDVPRKTSVPVAHSEPGLDHHTALAASPLESPRRDSSSALEDVRRRHLSDSFWMS